MNRANLRDERGATMILFAIMLPVILILGAAVVNIGNWWTHGRHLQTKVDASALAGGTVWGFPYGVDSDTNATGTGIVDVARQYVGPHTSAAGVVQAGGFNPQIGVADENDIHVVVNGADWWDDDPSVNPADFTTPAGSVCQAMILDVKSTEGNSPPLFGFLSLWPDVKRKARVQIEESPGLRGLLPIAVRVPKPLSAAAVFYNEQTGAILPDGVKYFREVCQPPPGVTTCIPGAPPGLGQWTQLDALGGNWANINVAQTTGVVIATSFRQACIIDPTTPCFDDTGFATVDSLCNQPPGHVQCSYATGSGASQIVRSGLQFIRGYDNSPNADDDPPVVRSVWLDSPSANCGAYFSAVTGSCSMDLSANVDIGSVMLPNPPGPPQESRTWPGNTEVRYKVVYGNTSPSGSVCDNWQPACELTPNDSVTVSPQYARHAIAIRVRFKETVVPGFPTCNNANYNPSCEWYFTSAGRTTNEPTDLVIFDHPVQRSFMGNLDRSGPVKWLRLSTDVTCNGWDAGDMQDGPAASQPLGSPHCFYMDMGLQGGLAKDQDEPPIQLNIGATSQSSVLDCDDDTTLNLRDEIRFGCQNPAYSVNKFNTNPLCPGTSQFFSTPKPFPFDSDYPPWRCVLTQPTAAAAPGQVMQGFNLRLFGVANNPVCPADPGTLPPPPDGPFAPGRNYWHNDNNDNDNYTYADNLVGYGVPDPNPLDNLSNRLKPAEEDKRKVNLFFTPYDSFTGSGNETFPVIAFGTFYITGYGYILGNGAFQGGQPEDPCTDGNDGNLYNGNGNEPPPDLDTSTSGAVVWGHYIKDVAPSSNTTGGSGIICKPLVSFQPCVAVLVE